MANHQNFFSTNLTSPIIAGATTTPLNSIPTCDAPFYLTLDATGLNSHQEVIYCTSKTATNVNHAATTYAHTTAEEVRMDVVADELDSVGFPGAWKAYTPTPTNLVVGAGGTLEGFYTQIGKTVIAKVHFVYGAGSSVSGAIVLSVPVTMKSNISANSQIGQCSIIDAGVQVYFGQVQFLSTTTIGINPANVAGTYMVSVPSSATVPMTWTTSDEFWAQFTYEAALINN